MQIIVHGKASGSQKVMTVENHELEQNLLTWLRSKDVLIASSCSGKGVCKKCVIQRDLLTCELTIAEFLDCEPTGVIEVNYL